MSDDAILLNKALSAIGKELDKHTKSIADGHCRVPNDAAATGAQYLYQVGYRDGLRRSDVLIRDAISKLSKGEE